MIDVSDADAVRREAERRTQLRVAGAASFDAGAHMPCGNDGRTTVEVRSAARAMNKTESRRAGELAALMVAGEIRWFAFEAITLKLAHDCRYTPDFFIVEHDGRIRFEETKGFWRDDARVKIRVAAEQFPMFSFVALVQRRKRLGGGWDVERFLGDALSGRLGFAPT